MSRFGKDDPTRFIDSALTGGGGTSVTEGKEQSNEIFTKSIGHGQKINTAFAMDNVKMALEIPSSIKDQKFAGAIDNIGHSLTGGDAVQDEMGAASKLKHQFEHGI